MKSHTTELFAKVPNIPLIVFKNNTESFHWHNDSQYFLSEEQQMVVRFEMTSKGGLLAVQFSNAKLGTEYAPIIAKVEIGAEFPTLTAVEEHLIATFKKCLKTKWFDKKFQRNLKNLKKYGFRDVGSSDNFIWHGYKCPANWQPELFENFI
jgi:hypothetical protein